MLPLLFTIAAGHGVINCFPVLRYLSDLQQRWFSWKHISKYVVLQIHNCCIWCTQAVGPGMPESTLKYWVTVGNLDSFWYGKGCRTKLTWPPSGRKPIINWIEVVVREMSVWKSPSVLNYSRKQHHFISVCNVSRVLFLLC